MLVVFFRVAFVSFLKGRGGGERGAAELERCVCCTSKASILLKYLTMIAVGIVLFIVVVLLVGWFIDVVWCGVVWCGVVRCGIVQDGVIGNVDAEDGSTGEGWCAAAAATAAAVRWAVPFHSDEMSTHNNSALKCACHALDPHQPSPIMQIFHNLYIFIYFK